MTDAEIIKSLEAIIAMLQDMQQVSAQQIQLLSDDLIDLDLAELDRLIEQRQSIMAEIDLVEAKLQNQMELISAPSNSVLLEVEKDVGYQKYMSIIKAVILAINENDSKYHSLLEKAMDLTKNKLNSVRHNQKAQKAYLQEEVYTEGWFIDKRK